MKADDYKTILVSDPFNVDARVSYVWALIKEEDWQSAIVQARLVLKSDATKRDVRLAIVEALWELDHAEEAKAEFFIWDESGVGRDKREPNEWDEVFKRGSVLMMPANETSQEFAKPTAAVEPEKRPINKIDFTDIVGMAELKEQLKLKIVMPFLRPEVYAKFKKNAGGGVLLYGPPGCGKTMFAKAIASECKAEFISVGISDILSKWMGESEQRMKQVFERARAKRPAVLFFDELDSLGGNRAKAAADWIRSITNEFLTQLDGVNSDNDGILVLGATNLPWEVDSALKRTGRFSRHMFLPPPDAEARAKMFELKLDGIPSEKFSFEKLAEKCAFYSGADIDGVLDYAKEVALSRSFSEGAEPMLKEKDVLEGISKIHPSTRDWIGTVTNLIKYGGGDPAYQEVETYLKTNRLL